MMMMMMMMVMTIYCSDMTLEESKEIDLHVGSQTQEH